MRYTQKSFTGGELTPALYARNELDKYSIGAKIIRNGIIHQEGAVSNRAGLTFVGEVKESNKKTRLIPFSFNTEQTYIIEVGDKYFRFIMDGGYIVNPDTDEIVEIETPYTTAELSMLKFAQSADVLTICHSNHPQAELSRSSHYTWELKNIDFKPNISAPTNVTAEWTGKTTNPRKYEYIVTAVDDNSEESERSVAVSVKGRYESTWEVGEYMTISWDKVENATEYNIYRNLNGIFAYIGTAQDTSFIDDKIEPDLSSTAPITKTPFADGNYPSCVNYYQQRKIYANTKNNPQTLYASQTGTSENFNVSRPLTASDAITLTIAEKEVNEIRHIIALNDLILLTSGAEWRLKGSDGTFSASPPPAASPQSFYGSADVAPVISGNMVLFVQAGGSILRDLGYTYVSDSYDGNELTIFANHLFEGKQILEMAYSKEPFRILWCVMSDGTVNALTYNPKQQIAGWCRHDTEGKFESVSVVREGFEDVAYFVVKREINGETKRYVERMETRIIDKVSDSVFLDSALKYKGESVDELSGLEHLEGKTVFVNADGGIESHLVQNGKIKLNNNASVISVGLPYEFELETLNLEGENTDGLLKLISRLFIKINKSREDFIVVGDDSSEVIQSRSIESINNSEKLITKTVDCGCYSIASSEVNIHIKQNKPLPLQILSITAELTTETANV